MTTKDKSLDNKGRVTLIVICTFVAITAAWFVTNLITKHSKFHQ